MVRLGLEFEGAHEVAAAPQLDPAADDLIQLVRVADHVREQPVHGSGMAGIKGETAADAVAHAGHVIHLRGEWGFVDAENLRAEAGEHPCPAAGGRTQIKAQIAGAGAFGQQGEGFPEFEVGPACGSILFSWNCTTPSGNGDEHRAEARMRLGSHSVHEPSGAVGAASPK